MIYFEELTETHLYGQDLETYYQGSSTSLLIMLSNQEGLHFKNHLFFKYHEIFGTDALPK